jgi:rhodanese-related sulfurtransferase
MIISTSELQQLLASPREREKFILLDVRRHDELHNGMIPHAHHLPLHELEEAFSLSSQDFKKKYGFEKPSKKKLIIVYCRTGGRSSIAASLLLQEGYTAKNYQGSIWEWSEIDENVKKYFH